MTISFFGLEETFIYDYLFSRIQTEFQQNENSAQLHFRTYTIFCHDYKPQPTSSYILSVVQIPKEKEFYLRRNFGNTSKDVQKWIKEILQETKLEFGSHYWGYAYVPLLSPLPLPSLSYPIIYDETKESS